MLSHKELEAMRKNGRIHQKIFAAIQDILAPDISAKSIDDLALKMVTDAGVLSAFT